jgi:hypothetical protein
MFQLLQATNNNGFMVQNGKIFLSDDHCVNNLNWFIYLCSQY